MVRLNRLLGHRAAPGRWAVSWSDGSCDVSRESDYSAVAGDPDCGGCECLWRNDQRADNGFAEDHDYSSQSLWCGCDTLINVNGRYEHGSNL